ncbi:AfsR/SARP family transcriptional regulator [Nesterenkonia sp. K-15-9-6]|uniref:AfsR/SARP family transcriptional regulator n=1 Tax=Nesterenkonia sp. K-15-9-6 TaxID=3093918 RepID=UPI004044973D
MRWRSPVVVFDVLGPVQVRRPDGPSWTPTGLQGLLLGLLLVHAGRPVSVDEIIDALWGGLTDSRTTHRLQTHVHRLRRALGPGVAITAEGGSYCLAAQGCDLDSDRFRRLMREAHQVMASDPARAVDLLRTSLDLWTGRPYQGLDHPLLTGEAERLEELRLCALEDLHHTEIVRGRTDAVTAELPALLREHPLRERLYEIQMLGQALTGRRADALATYRKARRTLAEELGVEPGVRLRRLEQDVLDGRDLSGVAPAPHQAGEAVSGAADGVADPPEAHVQVQQVSRPSELPGPPARLCGRTDELALVDHAVRSRAGVIAFTGVGGVGKTTLALHWAHTAVNAFPDGQLYAALGGFGPDAPLPPERVLGGFLRALGLDSRELPESTAERAAMFRSRVAGRRMLILLDDAATADQVRPLLPGTDHCQVVITSRDALSGLAVTDGALRVPVRPLPTAESRHLLTEELGGDAAALSPDTLTEVAEACGGIPLAVRLAADLVRDQAADRLQDLLAELRAPDGRLGALSRRSGSGSLREVLARSVHRLDDDAHLVLRRLGDLPGHSHDLRSVRVVTGLERRAAARAVDSLVRAHLVDRLPPRRLMLHDLVRDYARELAAVQDGGRPLGEAFAAYCEQQLRTARSAQAMVTPVDHQDPRTVAPLFDDRASAARWLDCTLETLLATAERAAAHGPLDFAPQLSALLRRHLDEHHRHDEMERLHRAALRAAQAQGSPSGEDTAQHNLGILALRRGRPSVAREHLRASLEIAERIEDDERSAASRNFLAGAYAAERDLGKAVHHLQESIGIYRRLKLPTVIHPLTNLATMRRWTGRSHLAMPLLQEALALAEQAEPADRPRYRLGPQNEMTAVQVARRDPQGALHAAEEALELSQRLGRWPKASATLAWRGTALWQQGRTEEAVRQIRDALDLAEAHQVSLGLATAHNGLAEVFRDLGRLTASEEHHRAALEHAGVAWEEELRAHRGLSETCRLTGRVTEAEAHLAAGLRICEAVDHQDTADLRRMLSAG